MNRFIPALLAMAAAGPAWGASDGIAPLDEGLKYADCTALVASDPSAAFDSALAWRHEDGGAPAWHCIGLALVALGHHAEAGEVFERAAEDLAQETAMRRSGRFFVGGGARTRRAS